MGPAQQAANGRLLAGATRTGGLMLVSRHPRQGGSIGSILKGCLMVPMVTAGLQPIMVRHYR
jgi:hypothetical protein